MAQVFKFDASLSYSGKSATNTIKVYLTKFLKLGNQGQVFDVALTPVTYKDPVVNYLLSKNPRSFYTCEAYIFIKVDKFNDGKNVSAKEFESKLKDALPYLCDKDGNPLDLEILQLSVKKF